MLLDRYLPEWDIAKENKISFLGSGLPDISVLRKIDFSRSFIIRSLFALRGLPSRRITIQRFLDIGFSLLEEDGREMVIGLVAQPWKLAGNLIRVNASEFMAFERNDFVKIGWNFRFEADTYDQQGGIRTITRIHATSISARTKFRMYWFLIGLFSGIIRKEMLRTIKQELNGAKCTN